MIKTRKWLFSNIILQFCLRLYKQGTMRTPKDSDPTPH